MNLESCPFCGCKMEVSTHPEWHYLVGDHAKNCSLREEEFYCERKPMALNSLVTRWNTRAPAIDDETKRMLVELLTEVRDATCLTPWSARIKAKRLLEKLGAE